MNRLILIAMPGPVELLVITLILMALVGVLARSRGRSPIAWLLVSIVLSPLLALLLFALMERCFPVEREGSATES